MTKSNQDTSEQNAQTADVSMPRRKFLGASAAAASAGAAGVAFPFISKADTPIRWRFQSTWPSEFIYHEVAKDWAGIVEELTEGRVQIEMMSAGSVVPGLQVQDATTDGILDGAHGIPGFWFGKNTAFGLYGAGPDFGMTAMELLGWVKYGGGAELYRELQDEAGVDVESFLLGPVPPEPFGWFNKEIADVDDLDGLSMRTAGLAVDMFNELGMSTVQMAPADIVPSLDRGVLDAAEFASATDDRVMGFPDVAKFYYQKSYHMANNPCEIMINRKSYEELPDDIKVKLKYAAEAASADMHWKNMHRMSTDYIELQTEEGVTTRETPESVLKAQLEAWDRVIARYSEDNPLFARIIESQKQWARRVVYWQNEVTPDRALAYTHYFGEGPAA